MTTVGFKRATIGIFDDSGALVDSHVFEGQTNKGATTSAEITGLSKDPVRVYGSDISYYVSQRGTGDVAVALNLLDAPEEFVDKMLGYDVGTDGIAFIGESTDAPYCSLLLESSNLKGDAALLGFFKGKFTKDGETLNTLTNETFTPEPDLYTFNAVTETRAGEANGQILGKYSGSDESAITKLKNLVVSTVPSG